MLPLRVRLLSLLAGLSSGCQSFSYYQQAAQGQWQLIHQKQPIAWLIQQDSTPERLKQALRRSQSIRQFAITQLQLPDNGSYQHYVDLQRPYPVWSVVAVPAYSFKPQLWCYPLVGCLSYRGYFNRDDAVTEAQAFDPVDWDVKVSPVQAYSTLGWLHDPLLNSFIFSTPERLAGLMFHELAHQKLYIADDTAFNEAFATFVEQQGVKLWLKAEAPERLQSYQQQQQNHQRIQQLLQHYRQRLQQAYDSPYANKAEVKQRLFQQLQQARYQLKAQYWPNDDSYDAWLAKPMNNADLLHQATYQHWVLAFEALWQQTGQFDRFYRAAAELAARPYAQRQQQLHRLRDWRLNDADAVEPAQ